MVDAAEVVCSRNAISVTTGSGSQVLVFSWVTIACQVIVLIWISVTAVAGARLCQVEGVDGAARPARSQGCGASRPERYNEKPPKTGPSLPIPSKTAGASESTGIILVVTRDGVESTGYLRLADSRCFREIWPVTKLWKISLPWGGAPPPPPPHGPTRCAMGGR